MHTSSLILQVSLNDDSFQSVQSMSLMIPSEIKMPLRVSFNISLTSSNVPCFKCGAAMRRQ